MKRHERDAGASDSGAGTGSAAGPRMLRVEADEASQRLDNFLLARLPGVPRSRVYRMVRRGEVRVNGGRVRPDRRLQAGDEVRVPPVRIASREDAATPAPWLEGRVLLERDDVLVLDKPAGLAVHGGSGVRKGLIESLRVTRSGERHLELAHRLDRETSGCLVVARSRSAVRRWHGLFRGRSVEKVYWALVAGHWPRRRTLCDAPLEKVLTRGGERRSRVSAEGRPARTRVAVLAHLEDATWLELRPETGRTHQIRVHLAAAGHAILGDDKYADEATLARAAALGIRGLCLHARALDVPGERVHVCAEAPPAFQSAVAALGGSISGEAR